MVKVWDVNTCEEIRTLLGHSGTVTAVKIIYPLVKTDADHANNKAELHNFIGRLNKGKRKQDLNQALSVFTLPISLVWYYEPSSFSNLTLKLKFSYLLEISL